MAEDFGGPALVLRKVDYGGADAVVTFLTRDHGRVAAFAKGARSRRGGRFAGALEPFTEVEARFRRRGPSAELVALTAADVTEAHGGLRRDLQCIAWASYAVEAARELCREGEEAGALFRILTGHLRALEDRGPNPEDRAAFELAALAAAGYAPRLLACGTCGRRPGPGTRWALSPAAGGLVCDGCGGASEHPLSPGAVASLSAVAGAIPPARPAVTFTPAVRAEVHGALPAYLEGVIGKGLRAFAFIRTMG